MKKVSKKFKPEEINLWMYKSVMYDECPTKKQRIAHYLIDEEDGMCVAVVKKPGIFLELLALLCVALTVVVFVMFKVPTQNVEVPDAISFDGGFMTVDINNTSTEYDVDVSITHEDVVILPEIRLAPGNSIGTVTNEISMEPGSYMCELKYTINTKLRPVTKVFNVMLVVE